mgnify:CR=1 FL=1
MKYRVLKCKATNEIKHVSSLEENAPSFSSEKYYLGEELTKEELINLGWDIEETETL